MDEEKLSLLVTVGFVILILLIIVIRIIRAKIYKETEERVKQKSERYQYFLKLSRDFPVEYVLQVYEYRRALKSKAQLDKLKIDVQMVNIISEEWSIPEIMTKAFTNQERLIEYEKAVALAPPTVEQEKPLYYEIESDLVVDLKDRSRPVVPYFRFVFYYTSPQGRMHYERAFEYTAAQLKQFYKMRELAVKNKQTVKYERNLMTDSLRYDIMKRDGFRCVLCGATAEDGVKLHVDHIKPVSKGGKTERSNLRTLCERCNLGKKAKYDEHGLN